MNQQVIYTFISSLFLNFTALASFSSPYLQKYYERIAQPRRNVSTINPFSNKQEYRTLFHLKLDFLTSPDFPPELRLHCLNFMEEEELLALRRVNKAYQELIKSYSDERALRLGLEPEAMLDYIKDVLKHPSVYRWIAKGSTWLYYKDEFTEENIGQARKYLRKLSQYSTTHPWEKVEASQELIRKVKLIFEKLHLHYLNQELQDNSHAPLVKFQHAKLLYFYSALTEQSLKEYYYKEAVSKVENILLTCTNQLTPSDSPQELLKLINARPSLNERVLGYQAIFLKGLLYESSKDEEKRKLPEGLYKALAEEKTIEPALKKWVVKSQTQLGLLYRYGRGVSQNYKEALKWFNKAATEEYPLALKELGEMYYTGQGTTKKEFEAWELFEKVASHGYRDGAMFTALSLIYENGIKKGRKDKRLAPDSAKSAVHAQQALEEGYGPAFRNAGMKAYLKQDYNRAIMLFEKAISKGYTESWMLNTLSSMHEQNPLAKLRFDKSVPLIKATAEQGKVLSQIILATIYEKGQGVKQNLKEAFKWYFKAAQLGNTFAQLKAAEMYEYGQGITCNYHEAFKWTLKAAKQNEPFARLNVGLMYLEGQGVKQDINEACYWLFENKSTNKAQFTSSQELTRLEYEELFKWYWAFAFRDSEAKAQVKIGWMCQKGIGRKYNSKEEAFGWYEKAAKQGNIYARYKVKIRSSNFREAEVMLGQIERASVKRGRFFYTLGIIYQADEKFIKAIAYFHKAIEEHYLKAYFDLGRNCYLGRGIQKDYPQAKTLLTQAEEKGLENEELLYILANIYQAECNFEKYTQYISKVKEKQQFISRILEANA
ncbi:MAG: SEL1-like repeat protein, partial [Alphaproteobacteria bacterium]|nr:SEL1-like repeat protein [Alphaproteobacteria bacterium]